MAHTLAFCKQFTKLSILMQIELVWQENICANCLRAGHTKVKCLSTWRCKICDKRHHTMLHDKSQNIDSHPLANSKPIIESGEQARITSLLNQSAEVILATAIVYIFDRYGNAVPCRALLDTGSQSNYVTSKLSSKLKLKKMRTSAMIAS